MIKRALLYIKRKKGKSLTLGFLIFLISTFVITILSLSQSASLITEDLRENLGGEINIQHYQPLVLHGQESVVTERVLNHELLQEILEVAGTNDYNVRQQDMVRGLTFVPGFASSEYDQMGSILGMNESISFPAFNSNVLEIKEGRHINEKDELVVVISETLAQINGFELGDFIKLQRAELGTNESGEFINTLHEQDLPYIQVQVIGIFQIHEAPNESLVPTAGLTVNQLFSDFKTLENLGLARNYYFDEITLHTTSPSYLNEVLDQLWEIDGVDKANLIITANDFGYGAISQEIKIMQNIILILSIVVGVVSIALLSLIIILRMRGRVQEVGILLSVGIPKKQIMTGFLLESAIISLVAFLISNLITTLTQPMINQAMLSSLLIDGEAVNSLSMLTKMSVYAVIILIILIVTMSVSLITIRLKPKQILSLGN